MLHQFSEVVRSPSPHSGPCEVCTISISPAGRIKLCRRKLYPSPGQQTMNEVRRWERLQARRRKVALSSVSLSWPAEGTQRPSDAEVVELVLAMLGERLGGSWKV